MIKFRCSFLVTLFLISLNTYSQTVNATAVNLLDGGSINFQPTQLQGDYYEQGFRFFDWSNQVAGGLTYNYVPGPISPSLSLGLGTKRMYIASNGATYLGYIYDIDSYTSFVEGESNTLNIKGTTFINGSIKGSGAGGALKVKTGSGSIDIGSQNASWAHIYTDRPKFILNKPLHVVGGVFSSYGNHDLLLQIGGSTKMTIENNGDVGIGTTTPDNSQGWHKVLDVNGQAHSKIIATSGQGGVKVGVFSHGAPWNDVVVGRLGTESNHDLVLMAGYGRDQVTIKADGNVGIGTTTPGIYKLAVNGSIRSKEVVVEPSPWPDYVFKDTYTLPSLEEVETYINAKGHLKNIPSAKEVEENGVKLGEINTRLLEKIEELTLYTIAQEKKIKSQEERLQKLEELLLKEKK